MSSSATGTQSSGFTQVMRPFPCPDSYSKIRFAIFPTIFNVLWVYRKNKESGLTNCSHPSLFKSIAMFPPSLFGLSKLHCTHQAVWGIWELQWKNNIVLWLQTVSHIIQSQTAAPHGDLKIILLTTVPCTLKMSTIIKIKDNWSSTRKISV